MTLITRMASLFKADMHGILDCLEEPEAVLKQAIRDMETEIEQGEQALTELVRREEKAQAFGAHLSETITTFADQIDVCFEEDNHDLARTFIRKKLEAKKRLQAANRALADVAAAKAAQAQRLNEHKEQLGAIVEKMQLYVASRPQNGGREPGAAFASHPSTVSEAEVEMAFLHEKRRRAGGGALE